MTRSAEAGALSDKQLLELEFDTLWMSDARGRAVRHRGRSGRAAPHCAIGVAADGLAVAIGSDVPDDAADLLLREISSHPQPGDPAAEPPAIAVCRAMLEPAVGAVELSSGLGYLVAQNTRFASPATIVRSGEVNAGTLLPRVPEPWGWGADEWRALLAGEMGPWAGAVADGVVVSLCHSARLTEVAAEAGVWTHADYRGRGLAAAVTAAWSSLFPDDGRRLFYSTSTGNHSSQRVAARLGLRLIGHLWMLSAPETSPPDVRRAA